MKRDLNHALDECLALLGEGQATLEECLALYPECASDLRPLLEIAFEIQRVPQPTPRPAAFAAGKQRMLKALDEKSRRQAALPTPLLRNAGWVAGVLRGRKKPPAWNRPSAFQRALATALVLVLIATGGLFLLSQPQVGVVQTATLDRVKGTVELLPAGSDTWRPASPGERVETGSRVRTGPLAAATLVFFDGSTTDLEAEAEVAIVQMSSRREGDRVIALRQTLGQTHSRVQPLPDRASRFEIETPTSVVAVRGTEFTTAVEADGTTRVAVVEGLVEVTAQEVTVSLRAGQETTVHPGRPPSTPTPQPHATPTPAPTSTPTTIATGTSMGTPVTPRARPTGTPQPPDQTVTPQPPDQTVTPQPPDQTVTPQPPGQTKTPQPPGQTKTPQPPGQTKTPQPPGQEKTPKSKKEK